MTAVLYAFATEPGIAPLAGAAPPDVVGRQLPRLIVALLNGESDRGVRFFPFIGQVGGRRQFLELQRLLPVESLLELHGQPEPPAIVVDGMLVGDGIRFRILDGTTGRERLDETVSATLLDFDTALRRIVFEVEGALGRTGAPPPPPRISGPGLGWYLIGRDELLAMEASLVRPDPGLGARAAEQAVASAAGEPLVRELVLAVARHSLHAGYDPETVGRLLRRAVAALAADDAFLLDALPLLDHAVGPDGSGEICAALCDRGVRTAPIVSRAAALRSRRGEADRSLELLRDAHAGGCRDATVLGQLAAAEAEAGNAASRDALADELAGYPDLPAAVARMVASCLIDRDLPAAALELVERAQGEHFDHAGLWLEKARAHLALLDGESAAAAVEECLRFALPGPVHDEAVRLQRFTANPEALGLIRAVEDALAAARHGDALRLCRRLLRVDRALPEAWLLAGVCRQRLQQPRRAARALRGALRLAPELGEAHNRLGVVLLSTGRSALAYTHLRRATELLPGQPSVWLHLAQAALRHGRRDEALAALDRAERLGAQPGHVAAVRGMIAVDG